MPILATALTAVTPLFWLTAVRPLSDMPGLAGALGCHWLLLRAVRVGAPLRDALVAAVACGAAVGLRSQVTWLVVPLLAWVLWQVWGRAGIRAAFGVGAAALAGVLAWAVPMVAITGGATAYRVALASQAGEDFEGVPMLVLQPGVRRLVSALVDTFVWPWGWWPVAAVMLGLALIGLGGLRGRRRLTTYLALGFGPYLVYHLLLQETETTRYALPLVPPVATLVVLACRTWAGRLALPLATAACVAALAVSVQAHRQYLGTAATVSEALAAMDAQARASATRPQVLMHRRVWAETRRARATLQPAPAYDVLPAPRAREWREAVEVWQREPDATVWWLIDPRRGDDLAIDPRARRLRQHVGWPLPVAAVLGGMRPHAFDWTTIDRPQWMLIGGWGLTPELAGLAAAAGEGPSTGGASALVRSQPGASTIVIGGRHVAPAGAAAATLAVRIGADWQQEVRVPPGPFVFSWPLPAGVGRAGAYVPLLVTTTDAGRAPERIFLEQFDLQPAGTPVIALESGWHEPERDTTTGRRWRWVADESHLRIAGTEGAVRLVVGGTWPRHYDRDPVVELLVAGRRIAAYTLTRPFRFEQVVTAEQLRAGGGRITWRVSPSFVAGERTGTADARRLALEIGTLDVQAIR
jgi:hypothetical protein